MTPISEVLLPENVILNLAATDKTSAVAEILSKLSIHPDVHDFAELERAVQTRDAASITENHVGICIAHGRTDSVSALVLAVGRSASGVPCREIADPLKLIFVAGIPSAFSAEYLRIVGVIARVCRDRHQLDRLLSVRSAADFIDILSEGELRL